MSQGSSAVLRFDDTKNEATFLALFALDPNKPGHAIDQITWDSLPQTSEKGTAFIFGSPAISHRS
jgi:hypothetical protein